ncbi:hypothetical protein PQE75_gp144 [Bacillus phage vB_BcoS-136]|uniref:Uncharacterized protein n=1 Tax=Bacillus phage vB_BcoS-136 TaxID=2419619 RepID=A0A3G3BVP6_9CAUD|nr:hypothetical protein PQE75_gp144 [Bacillus phage vB_BcoS-136]AYP68335.1 hypothetical protein vBBcoS136_00221 [Bacillus phage vB_BcoS-136]
MGLVRIWELSTSKDDYGVTQVECKFLIEYDDGQIISSTISFMKYNYIYQDILTCIQKYFKGDLQLL